MIIDFAKFPFTTMDGENTTAIIERDEYAAQKGSLALFIEYEYDGETERLPVTVFIKPLPEGCAALDRNNLEDYDYWEQVVELIKDNELGEFIGEIPSGFCMYPVVKFDEQRLRTCLLPF